MDVLEEFERLVQSDPLSVQKWIEYANAMRTASAASRFMIYERALAQLPKSYKLWYHYLMDRTAHVQERPLSDPLWNVCNSCFERALSELPLMPVLWLEYARHLQRQHKITSTRLLFDRALETLPLSQHARIWQKYMEFAQSCQCLSTAEAVWVRFLVFNPSSLEDFVNYCMEHELWKRAARLLVTIVDTQDLASQKNHPVREYMLQLCRVCAEHASDVLSLRIDLDSVMQRAVKKFGEDVGDFWCFFAQYHIAQGQFVQARSIYERAISSVVTARDFAQVYDAYTAMEEHLLSKMVEGSSGEIPEVLELSALRSWSDEHETAFRMARLEDLVDRRPLLLNAVLLRQNPHNVHEWHKRFKLMHARKVPNAEVLKAYTAALEQIDPLSPYGKSHTIWLSYARFLESTMKDVDAARSVFEQTVEIGFRKSEENADVWCQWAEMEVRQGSLERAIAVLKRITVDVNPAGIEHVDADRSRNATAARKPVSFDEAPSLDRVPLVPKLWGMLCDLVENSGDVSHALEIYHTCLTRKVATPAIVLAAVDMLVEHKRWEDCFRLLERAVSSTFAWPQTEVLWKRYLPLFVERSRGTQIERTRDLFEKALLQGPQCLFFYQQYAAFEAEFGLERRAMQVYERALLHVDKSLRMDLLRVYVQRLASSFGSTRCRPALDKAFEKDVLADRDALQVALAYAEMERQLGETDRARALFHFAAQIANPRVVGERLTDDFRDAWSSFESKHGTVDTYADMMRILRTTILRFEPGANLKTATMLTGSVEAAIDQIVNPRAGKRARTESHGFVSASASALPPSSAEAGAPSVHAATEDPNEIEI